MSFPKKHEIDVTNEDAKLSNSKIDNVNICLHVQLMFSFHKTAA